MAYAKARVDLEGAGPSVTAFLGTYLDTIAERGWTMRPVVNVNADLLAAAKEAFATLTDEDACNIAPLACSDNLHERAAGLLEIAIANNDRSDG